MRTPVARILISLALFWIAARQIYAEIRTPESSFLDFSELCIGIGWIVIIVLLLYIAYLSWRIFEIHREKERQLFIEEGYLKTSRQRIITGTRMTVSFITLWILVGMIGWNYLLSQPYLQLSPEPTALAAGETATFTIETDYSLLSVRASRAYRVEERCEKYRDDDALYDGDSFTVKACNDGIGQIRVYSGVYSGKKLLHEYQLGSLSEGSEVAYSRISFGHDDGPAEYYGPGRFDLDEFGGSYQAFSWHSGQILLAIGFRDLEMAAPLDGYFVDILDLYGKQIVRLDFRNARKIEAEDAPSYMQEHLSLDTLMNSIIFIWSPCAKPWGEAGSLGISFVEKSDSTATYDTSACEAQA